MSYEPSPKCLISWHQVRKCIRHCLRFACAHTGFTFDTVSPEFCFFPHLYVWGHQRKGFERGASNIYY